MIAGLMAQGIVNIFKMIQVNQHDPDQCAGFFGDLNCLFGFFPESSAVNQLGQIIDFTAES